MLEPTPGDRYELPIDDLMAAGGVLPDAGAWLSGSALPWIDPVPLAAVAERFLVQQGAHVVITDANADAVLDATRALIKALGADPMPHQS